MPLGLTEVVDMDEGAVFHLMPFMFAPQTLVAEFLVCPVPWTINSLLDVANLIAIEGGSG